MSLICAYLLIVMKYFAECSGTKYTEIGAKSVGLVTLVNNCSMFKVINFCDSSEAR